MMSTNRIIVAIILLTFALISFIKGGLLLALFMGVFIFIGVRELVDIAKVKGLNPPFYFIVLANFILLSLATFKLYDLLFPVFTILLILSFLIILFRGKQATMNDISMTIFAMIYSGIFPMHLMMISNLNMSYVLLLLVTVAACDTGAYYAGMALGKTPLWKEVSPKKTVEGAVGGSLFAIGMALFFGHFAGLHIIDSIILGLLMIIFAQLGDLAESMIKRDAGVKDSGTVFPGHGGVLDRVDSYILTVVVVYYYLKFFVA